MSICVYTEPRSSGKCVVHLRVQGGLGEQHGVLLWRDTELVVEGVMPDLFHVIPVCHNTMVDWVFEGEDTTLRLGFITVGGWAWSVCSTLGLVGSPIERRTARCTGGRGQVREDSEDRYIPHVGVLLTHADHDTLVAGTTDN